MLYRFTRRSTLRTRDMRTSCHLHFLLSLLMSLGCRFLRILKEQNFLNLKSWRIFTSNSIISPLINMQNDHQGVLLIWFVTCSYSWQLPQQKQNCVASQRRAKCGKILSRRHGNSTSFSEQFFCSFVLVGIFLQQFFTSPYQ